MKYVYVCEYKFIGMEEEKYDNLYGKRVHVHSGIEYRRMYVNLACDV